MIEAFIHWFLISLGLVATLLLWALLIKPAIQATSVMLLSLYVGMRGGLKFPGWQIFGLWKHFFRTMFASEPLSVSGNGWTWRGVFKWHIHGGRRHD